MGHAISDTQQPAPTPRAFIDDVQIAEEYPIARSKLQKLRCEGNGPRYYKIGRKVCYERADVEAWIRSHARQNTSEDPRGAA